MGVRKYDLSQTEQHDELVTCGSSPELTRLVCEWELQSRSLKSMEVIGHYSLSNHPFFAST